VAKLLLIDFEGSVALADVAILLFERFGEGWQPAFERWTRGEISREEFITAGVAPLRADLAAMERFVRDHARIDEGLGEVYDWATWNGWGAALLAATPDFAVDTLLEPLHLTRLLRYAPRTAYRYRWQARFFSPRGIEVSRRFKLSYVEAYRRLGDFVVYVGARGDPEAAREATLALDRGPSSQFPTFENLSALAEKLREGGEAWLRSWCSTTAEEGSWNSSPPP